MTNAQAALMAAATLNQGRLITAAEFLENTTGFKAWLDKQDAQATPPTNPGAVGSPITAAPASPGAAAPSPAAAAPATP